MTSSLSLVDMFGIGISQVSGGPFTLQPGASQLLAPTSTAPGTEGAYTLWLTLWHHGVVIAQAQQPVQVVAMQIAALEGPEEIARGETAEFAVILANFTSQAEQVECGLSIGKESGQHVASLAPQTTIVPANGQVKLDFTWDGVAPAGIYQVVASAQPGAYPARSQVGLLTVIAGKDIYLPCVFKH